MIEYTVGDATLPADEGNRILCHVNNDEGRWGSGFVLAVSARYPRAERQYRAWAMGRLGESIPMHLGMVQFVRVEDTLWIANMVAQRGLKSALNPKPLQLEALRECLKKVAQRATTLQASVHMPRIGTARGGANWKEIEPLIIEELVANQIKVVVYDQKRSQGPIKSDAPISNSRSSGR